MALKEDIPDYMEETAKRLAEFLGTDEEIIWESLQATPEAVKTIQSDLCVNFIATTVNLLPPYVYPNLIPGTPHETVKETAKVLMPIWDKARSLIFPRRRETAEDLKIKIAKLRSEYFIAIKLNPTVASEKHYLFNRIRVTICQCWGIAFGEVPPPKILLTLPRTEREEVKAMMGEISPKERSILETISPIVIGKVKTVVEQMQQEKEGKISELTSAGVHPKIAARRIQVSLKMDDIYSPTKEDLLTLATDEKRLYTLVDVIHARKRV